ncbi:MAG: HEAT repeat domain-containing protein [Anaerolineae bacterium]|nr:HEAT repeat domain-containing protein [Anaerolineae bacterium]
MAMVTQLSALGWGPLSAHAGIARVVYQVVWRPDLVSALVGLAAGLILALLLGLLWSRIRAARARRRGGLLGLRARLSRRGEDRYREQLIEHAEQNHLLHRYASLSQMYVPPSLVVPHAVPPVLQQLAGEEGGARWREVRLHEAMHPSVVAVSLGEALRQHARLAFLGRAGSGKTVLLSYLALLYARRQGWQLFSPEEQPGETPEERSTRRREQARLPVLVPLERLDLALAERGGRHALVQPIVGLVAGSSALLFRSRIVAGESLLLFDNLDLLDARGQKAALAWVAELVRTYPGNVFVVAGSVDGYGALSEIGFAPLLLEAWPAREVRRFANRWERVARTGFEGAEWGLDGERDGAHAEHEHAPAASASLSLLDAWPGARREQVAPIDLALAAFLAAQGRAVPADPTGRYAQVVLCALEQLGEPGLTPPRWARVLSDLAWDMEVLGEHTVARMSLEHAVRDVLEDAPLTPTGVHRVPESGDGGQGQAQRASVVVQALLDAGDLVAPSGTEALAFVHPSLRAYLAAMHAARTDQAPILVAHVRDPLWQDMLGFYAALSDPTPLARARLQGVDDVFYSNLFAAAEYLASSQKADRQLRSSVLARLGRILLDPAQPAQLRRRTASVLARFQERGVPMLFAQAMQHQDPQVRCMGVQGLALLGGEHVVAGLRHALRDADRMVRIEALYGLAAWGGEVALEALVLGLQDEHELARQVAAELLAEMEGEGQELLRQAAEMEDMYIRRAAMFGLAALGEPWALHVVDRARRDDGEWFVRSAAEEVMQRLDGAVPRIVPDAAGLEANGWLVDWATSNDVACASPEDARQALIRALQQGNQRIKVAAADALRAHGTVDAIPALRAALRDERLLVCEAAFSALWDISRRTGARITA